MALEGSQSHVTKAVICIITHDGPRCSGSCDCPAGGSSMLVQCGCLRERAAAGSSSPAQGRALGEYALLFNEAVPAIHPRESVMAAPEVDAGYGSLGAYSAVHRPTRRKKLLSIVLAVASILLCAALVSIGNSNFFGISFTGRSSELLATEPAAKSAASLVHPDALPGYVENWGNQTPTAMIYARHRPVLDGVVDFYMNFPTGSRKLRAPKWFMGIPVRRNSAAALKQVETALISGEIKRFPAVSTPSSHSNRKLLGLMGAMKKFAKKPAKGKTGAPKATKAKPSTKGGKTTSQSGKTARSSSGGSSSEAPQSQVDCCLPACALGTLPYEFNGARGCEACKTTPEKNKCTSVIGAAIGQWKVCKKLVAKRPISKGDIVKPLFDPSICKLGGGSGGVPSPPPPPPLPVPSCAIDKSGKFAGCKECTDPKQFPAVDGRICNGILSKSKPVVGVTVVTRSDNLPDPNPPAPPPPPAPIPSKSSASSNSATSSSSKKKSAKMCSHDPTKLNGDGKGCATCQGKGITAATADLPGNDYWACSLCRDKGVCDFNCKQNLQTKVWQCTQGKPGPAPSPLPQAEPECLADKKMNWKASSNAMRCQGYMCKRAGLQPSGEYGPLSYPKLNAYPKKLDAKSCCPFVAQGLTSASCYQKFGCEVPLTLANGKTQWDLQDHVKSCKNFFCLQGVSSPAEWAQKQGDSKFADGINKGRSACCAKLLASVPDGKESWCPKPTVDPNCKGSDCKPVVTMDEQECQTFLCQQTPMISNVGDSYALWLEQQRSSGSRRLLQAAVAPKPAASSQAAQSVSASSKNQPELDPNVGLCVRTLQLTGIESWQTNPHCVKEEDKIDEEENEAEGGEPEEEEKREVATGGEGGKAEHAETGGNAEHEGEKGEHEGEKEEKESVEHEPELKKEEIPESECDEESGPESLPLLPGANVLGHTYDPEFGLAGCNFDRCVIRPFIKYSYKQCKVVETPAGQFKVPDQIYAFNLYETSAQTHMYENEREEQKSNEQSAHISGSYGMFSGSATMDRSESSESSSKQHIAVRKIDVHLYRLTLLNTKSFDSLRPEFLDAFKMLPARFEDNVHDYIQFLRDWGRYVATSGTFGGSVEIRMKFVSASSASKEDFHAGVEMSVDVGMFSASGGVSGGYTNDAKSIDNNNELSIDSSGGDPAVAALISDVKSAEEANFRDDLQSWLESLPKYPRLVEDWPILAVLTKFIPNSPSEDGAFDPFTRNQGLLQALRILHEDGATSMFDKRKCYPPPPPPDVKQLPVPAPIPASKVRIFEHCDYWGASLALAPGEYDESHLQNRGGFNFVNAISALRIDQGYTVILYSQPGFQGETLVLTKDDSCLVNDNYDHVAMSLKIIEGSGQIQATGNKRKQKPLPSGRTSIAFNNFDRMHVGQCLSFTAETSGSIYLYLFSSPVSQLDAYSFQVGTKDVKLVKGLYAQASLLKKSSDTNALAFGQASLFQNVWFCVYPDAEDGTATVFSYGRGSYTLFEYVEKAPVLINYFAFDCSEIATYRSILVIKASRWIESVNPFNRVCAILNCQKVQETESESGICACEQCQHGYQPFNNNEECVVADQCPAQFGCLAANPPECACEECCCGLSYDPVTQNCVNANLKWKADTSVGDNLAIIGTEGESKSIVLREASHTFNGWWGMFGHVGFQLPPGMGCPYVYYLLRWCSYTPAETLDVDSITNKMETKFKAGSSYRLKKLMFACTETSVQNIRVSYDASSPALGFIDYDSTHLVTKSDTAGKFDFSIYDNLRKSVQANPLFSASGFLNLDEVKLEEVTLGSLAKKSGNALQDMFKFMVEGSKEFAKNIETEGKKLVQAANKVANDIKNKAEDFKNKAVDVLNNLKNKAQEMIEIADGEFKKFMKVADKAYKSTVAFVQKSAQTAINLVADNAGLLKTVLNVGGAVGAGIAGLVPQLMNLIPGWYVVL